jgi:hypothetical protein
MAEFPFHRGPASELDESVLDLLLARQPLPLDAPRQVRMTADALASLSDPQRPGALAGEAAARSAFASAAASPAIGLPAARPPARPTRVWRFVVTRPRLAAVLAAVAVSLGGTTAAAYAGALPAPVQDIAHLAIGAPAVHHAAPRPQPRRIASQLCAAYQRAQAHSGPAIRAAQARALATAAGGAGKISAYCASPRVPGTASARHGSLGHAKAHPAGSARARQNPKARGGQNPHAHPHASAKPKVHGQPHARTQLKA